MYHRSDSKNRVHAFRCVSETSLMWWLHRHAQEDRRGLTLEEFKDELNGTHSMDPVEPPFEGKCNPRPV